MKNGANFCRDGDRPQNHQILLATVILPLKYDGLPSCNSISFARGFVMDHKPKLFYPRLAPAGLPPLSAGPKVEWDLTPFQRIPESKTLGTASQVKQ